VPARVDPLIGIVRKYGMVSKSNWALARGIPSKHFFDMDKGTHASESIQAISDRYIEKIKEIMTRDPKIDRLAFIEKEFGTVGALPLMSFIVSQTGIEATIIRLRKELSLVSQKGAKITSENNVVIINDVLTSGESIEKAAKIIMSTGAKVRYAVVLYDREQGGKKRLERLGIQVEVSLTREQLMAAGDLPRQPEAEFSLEEEVIAPSQTRIEQFEKALSRKSRKMLECVYIK